MTKKITQEYVLKVVASGLKEITKEIKTLNTNLTGVDKSVASTGKSFDSAGKKQDTYLRGTKGAAQATNNSTKAFSKMAQNMNGTLVPAYAAIAANIFALTAAFGALKRAADLQILIESAETLAIQTGRSLTSLSASMKGITNNALTMKEALESASIAASAGFDDTTIKNLTQVARNASVALGRDMTDSLNRVFKGAIKAEPELLDELGIILRLDTAARNYAATLGKSAKALTTFEKQQAVVNAVIEQGEDKFGEFADVDVNPYTQLAASFQDISASLIAIINVPISPVLRFLTENVTALTAVIVLFSASVLKRAFPALENFAQVMETKLARATEAASTAFEKAKSVNFSYTDSLRGTTKESIKLLASFSRGVENFQETIESSKKVGKNFKEAFTLGTDSVKGLQAYKRGLKQVITTLNQGAKISQGFTQQDTRSLVEEYDEVSNVLKKVKNNVVTIDKQIKITGSNAVLAFTKMKLSVIAFGSAVTKSATAGALAGYTEGFKGISIVLKNITAETTGFTRVASIATASITGLGGAFLKMIPLIGQVIFAWTLLSSAFTAIRDFIFEKSLVDLSETLADNTKALETAAKSAEFFNNRLKELPDTLDNVEKKAKLVSNTMGTLADNLEKTLKDIDIDKGFSGFDEFLDAFALGNLDEFKDQLDSINNTIDSFGSQTEATAILNEFQNLLRLSGDEAVKAGDKLLTHLQAIRDSSRGTLELNTLIKDSLGELSKGLTQLHDGLPALTGVEKGFFNLNTILNSLDVGNIHQVTSAINSLSEFDLRQLGLTNIVNNITQINKPLEDLNKSLKSSKDELAKIQKLREQAASYDDASYEIVTKQTEQDFNRLSAQILAAQGGIDGITLRLKEQSADIIKQLDKVKIRFQAIINAQKEIADIRSQNAVSNLEEGKGLEKRLSLLSNITDAENNYLRTITSQTKFSLDSITKAIKDTEAKLKLVGDDEGKQASLTKVLQAERSTQQQLENKLLENRNKTASNYIKQIKAVQKELSKITKFAAAGLTVSKEQARIVQEELYTSYLNLAIAQGDSVSKAIKFAAQMTAAAVAVQDFNAFLQQTRMPSVSTLISDISGLEARAETLGTEAQYLEDNNTLLNERIDKEFILAQAINDRLITEAEFKVAELQETDPDANLKATAEAQKLLNGLKLKSQMIDVVAKKTVDNLMKAKLKGMKEELKFSKDLLNLGVLATKAQIQDLKLQKTIHDLRKKWSKEAVDDFEKFIKAQQKADFSKEFNEGISSMIEGMSQYSSIMTELNDNLDKLDESQKAAAGMKALSDIAAVSGNNVSKAFADMGLLVDAYSDKLASGEMSAREWSSFTMSALGAMSQMFEQGSSEAKALAVAQQALAIVNAVSSIAAAASSGDPYTAPARVAHMIGLMSAVLGMAGLGLGGGVSGAGSADDYKDTISDQGLVGQRDLQSISLVESIDGLVAIDTELFSSNRELQLTLVNLNKTFSRLGSSLFGAGGSFEATNILDLFGISFGTGAGGNFLSSSSTTNALVDAGIQLSASIDLVGTDLVASLTDASFFLVESITTTKKKLGGLSSSTSTYLKTTFESITSDLEKQLSVALFRIGNVVTDLFSNFTSILDINLTTLFEGLGTVAFKNLKISLTGKSADEQSEALASFVSLLSTTLIERLVPMIGVFSLAGEELIDTLIRITENIWKLEASFNTLGASISSYIDTSTLTALNINDIYDEAFGGDVIDTSALDQLGAQYTKLVEYTEDYIIDLGFLTILYKDIITKTKTVLLSESEIKTNIESAVEAMKIAVVAAWEESFLDNFKDFEEFSAIFEIFSNTLYTESELAQQALLNAESTVSGGFESLRNTLVLLGEDELLAALGTTNTEAALRSVFELGNEIGAFAARFDASTGEIDTAGADLLALIIQLGAAMGYQQDAIEELADVLDNLNSQYERQIALFGLLGKELELLELSFDFQDALLEAQKTGTDLALVESYYGLLRLDIIRQYNQEIVDSIDEAMSNVSEAILTVLASSKGWDEVAFQSIKATKIVEKLATSLGNISTNIDFTIFDSLSDTSDFLSDLENFIDVTIADPTSIEDQINLVNDLKDTILARYDAEVAAAEDLEASIANSISTLKDLSGEINNFIDELFVGELSPLTNAQKLAEAQTQFDENLQNVLSQDTELAESAREDLLQSASTLLELADLFWSIGPEYQAIFNGVVGSLEEIGENLLSEISVSQETLAINSLEESLTELQLQTLTQLQTLDDILLNLEEQNAINLVNELSGQMPEVINNLDAIITKLDQVNNDSWNPILAELISLNNTMTNIGSFAKGSEEIQYDQVAMIHKGETILTADTSNSIRSGESIYGSSDAVFSNNGDSSDVVDAIRVLTQVIASGQEDMLEKNEEIRSTTKDLGTNLGFSSIASVKGIV